MSLFTSRTPSGGLASLLDFIAAEETRTAAWETKLASWERPASPTEEDQIERAARMVRAAIAANAWLTGEGVTVEPQGSYFNNTNVRLEADMDLRVVHPAICVVVDGNVQAAGAYAAANYRDAGRTNGEIAKTLRAQVHQALANKFGETNVDSGGSKAFRVSAVPGSRADVDVVPALTLDYVAQTPGLTLLSQPMIAPVRGILIIGKDGRETVNFPVRHHRNGVAKRARTGRAFKKVVRQLKSMRDHLVASRKLARGTCPSFLIECLAYAVEDHHYLVDELRRPRLKRVLAGMQELLSNVYSVTAAKEINGVKALFGSHQPWLPADAATFVTMALAELDA